MRENCLSGLGGRGRGNSCLLPTSAGGTPAATELLERALGDYNRTLAWVERYPANVKESRKPFVEKRREVYLKLGRVADAAADERELKSNAK